MQESVVENTTVPDPKVLPEEPVPDPKVLPEEPVPVVITTEDAKLTEAVTVNPVVPVVPVDS